MDQAAVAFRIGPDIEDRLAIVPIGGIVVEKPLDKRSTLINRKVAPRQVLCYLCCAEFGTSSLPIHQKTCLKKHAWGLNNVANEEGVSKKQAALNRKKCADPGTEPSLTIPAHDSPAEKFSEYNEEAANIFFEHASRWYYSYNCYLWNVDFYCILFSVITAVRQMSRQWRHLVN